MITNDKWTRWPKPTYDEWYHPDPPKMARRFIKNNTQNPSYVDMKATSPASPRNTYDCMTIITTGDKG